MQIKPEDYTVILDERGLALLKERIARDTVISYDRETTSLKWVTGTSFMQTFYVADRGFVIDRRQVSPALWAMCASACVLREDRDILGHNLKFDLLYSRNEEGLRRRGRVQDTLLLSFLLDENRSHRLKDLCEAKWGPEASSLEKQIKEWMAANGCENQYDKVPPELMAHYAVQDTFLCRKYYDAERPKLPPSMVKLYENECELTKVLVDMEYQGIRVDVPYLESLVPQFELDQKLIEQQVWQVAGEEFNINSSPQLADILYRKLGLKAKVYTEKGAPSTDKEALQTLDHPIGQLLLQHSGLETALHTFVKPWISFADKNGYLHSSFNQTGTRAGRFSSSDPNAQQIPKRTKLAKVLRKAFIYPDGTVGGSNDQCQMEMIGFAHYSADPNMRKALNEGRDLHRQTATDLKLATAYEEVTSDQRKLGKGGNFAIVYGCGKAKLSSFLSQDMYAGRMVTHEEAMQLLSMYKQAYPYVSAFTQRVINTVRTRPGHYVENMFGRRCHLTPDKAYIGVNRLIQSWAADAMKIGMVRAWKKAEGTDLKLYANIHDDLRWFCKPENFMDHARTIDKCLTQFDGMTVPIKTDTTRSLTNWAEEEEVKL